MPVYVLNKDGKPLMPTTRNCYVRIMLKTGKAKVVKQKPFTIQLLYECGNYTQPLCGGTDPGRTNIGEAVIDDDGQVLYNAHITTRNKEIPKLMAERKAHRNASRSGERKRRQRRALKNGTITFPLETERVLPGYEEPIINRYVTNTEARFNNRKRPANWLTPTTNQLVQTHLNAVQKISSILPVTDWTLEINRFAFMKMEDGTIRGIDFQNGRMKGYKSVDDYIFTLQDGKCAICGKPLHEHWHNHHIKPKSQGGSDGPENRVGVCEDCHKDIHTKKAILAKIGKEKWYAALSVLNQAIPFIYDRLVEMFGEEHVHTCEGWETSEQRKRLRLEKTHHSDAVCIASLGNQSAPVNIPEPFEIKQFRRHNRAIINNQRERTYKLDGVVVAKNREPRFEQKGDSLDMFLESLPVEQRQAVCSKLTVEKSKRHYNTKGRYLPGTIFYYQGHRYILSGQASYGQVYQAVNMKSRFPAKKCKIIQNGGLVYV